MENYLKLYKNREEYEQSSGISIFSHIIDEAGLIVHTIDPCDTPNVEVIVTMPSETIYENYAALNLFKYDFFRDWDNKPFNVFVDKKEVVLETSDMTREEANQLANEGRLVIIETVTIREEPIDVYQLVSIENKQHKIKFVFDSSWANEQYCFEAFNICDRNYTSTTNIVYDNPSKFTCIEDGGCMH